MTVQKKPANCFISIIAAVAEMERENIRVQTMAGREQKAREGKWNGRFAPYGYRLENGELVIAEDEVEIIQMIFDRYIHTNDGINGVASLRFMSLRKIRLMQTAYMDFLVLLMKCIQNVRMQKRNSSCRHLLNALIYSWKDGNWIQNIKFQFPVPIIKEGKEVAQIKGISLDKEKSEEHMVSLEKLSTLETVVLMSKVNLNK